MRMFVMMVAIVFSTSSATAQSGSSLIDAVGAAKRTHNDCVSRSVAAQLGNIAPSARRQADINMLIEQGFQACLTEEQVLVAILNTSSMGPADKNIAIIGNRISVKRHLNDVFIHPENYVGR